MNNIKISNNESPKVKIFIPKILKKYLTLCAEQHQFTLEAEIIERLTASFEHAKAYEALQVIMSETIDSIISNKLRGAI